MTGAQTLAKFQLTLHSGKAYFSLFGIECQTNAIDGSAIELRANKNRERGVESDR